MFKILVISRDPWRTDNSFGNTYSNWFSKMSDIDIAHLCLADGKPLKEKNVSCYYQVSEKELAHSVIKSHKHDNAVGRIIEAENNSIEKKAETNNKDKSFFGRALDFGKRHHPPLLFLAREAIWKYGNVNYEGIYEFVEKFKPDVVFMAMYYAAYVDRIALHIYNKLRIPIVLEAAIDVYTLKQISFDPFFWINRFYIRYKTRQIIKVSKLLYVISEKQRRDYCRLFKLPVKVIYKFPDIHRMKFSYQNSKRNLRYLYTGNIGLGRWKSLSFLASALKEQGGGVLDIYTANPLSEEQKNKLNIDGVSAVHPPITQGEVIEMQNDADILVHVESFNLKNKLQVRYSISTKIMDYISVGRCILGIGPSDVASIEYLQDNSIALIATNEQEVFEIVKTINSSRQTVSEVAKQSEHFTRFSLNGDEQRKQFLKDLKDASGIKS